MVLYGFGIVILKMDSSIQKGFFENTPVEVWEPVYEKFINCMHEVELENNIIGYIFLSVRSDHTAHLGYGIYKEFRGKGYSVKMCQTYLDQQLLKLNNVEKVLATSLSDNALSQKVLKKLGFKFVSKIKSSDFDYVRFEKEILR